jgi:hypothetical protein
MVSANPSGWEKLLQNPWQIAIIAYLVIGIIVVGVVSIRGMRFRRPPLDGGSLWEEKDNTRNELFLFLAAGKTVGPIGFLLEVVLWPVWLVFILLSR